MVCRAPTPAVGSCASAGGQNTGQQLTYDAEGRLVGWQDVPGGSPNATASFRYDGEGERVAQQTTSSGTTTTRYLLGGIEELTTVGSGSTTTLTTYYSVPGVVTAVKVGTTLSYLATDGLGSVSVALAAAGSTTGQALYLPYGAGRYSSGSMPTARGYTGQYQDSSSSGLDYYGARYYDPALGQFTSADTVLAGGLNRYAYAEGNPTTATDPSGHGAAPPGAPPDLGSLETILAQAEAIVAAAFAAGAVATAPAWVPAVAAAALLVVAGLVLVDTWRNGTSGSFTPQYPGAAPVATPTPQPTYPGQAGGSWTQEQLDAIRAASLAHRHLPTNTPTKPTKPTKPTTPTTPAPTAPGPQPQPGGGGTPGGIPPTPAGGTCGCDPGDDRPVNSKGVPYPSFIDPRTGDEIPFPKGPLSEVDPADRVDYDGAWDKHLYIKEWYDRGYPSLPGPWTQFELHHILPRQFGGGNDFWNLVPLSHQDHLQYTNWWKYYCP